MIRTDIVRAAWGLCQVVAAPSIARAELGHDADTVTTWAIRILGARQIVQGAILSRTASRTAHRVGGVIDILHASSMVIVAIANPGRRRAAIIDGSVASCLAIAELRR
ncbi:MAG TPA: hypothetical protein VIJ18_05045 [Microbacteriaceae bacterium]